MEVVLKVDAKNTFNSLDKGMLFSEESTIYSLFEPTKQKIFDDDKIYHLKMTVTFL